MITPIIQNNVEYKFNKDLVNFIDKYINDIIDKNKKLDTKQTISFIKLLHGKTIEYNKQLNLFKEDSKTQNSHLDRLRYQKYQIIVNAKNDFNHFNHKLYIPGKQNI